jgi:hypothetical protein
MVIRFFNGLLLAGTALALIPAAAAAPQSTGAETRQMAQAGPGPEEAGEPRRRPQR